MSRRVALLAVLLALTAAVALWSSRARDQPAGARGLAISLIDELPQALETPLPPPPRTLYRLQKLPQGADQGRVSLTVAAEPERPLVMRARLRMHQGQRAAIRFVAVAQGDEQPEPRPAPQAPAAVEPVNNLQQCIASDEEPEGWVDCSRLFNLPLGRGGLQINIEDAERGVRDLEVLEAESADPRLPRDPVLARLVKRSGADGASGVSWRNALIGGRGQRYAFEVLAPAQGEFTFATGHELGGWGAPLRFVVRENGATLLDEVVPRDEKWHEHRLPLKTRAGQPARLELETLAVQNDPGGPARGLWATPVVRPASSAPNIVLVTIDALRPDHTSAYGYQRDTTPTLQLLAKAGTLFERATSQAGSTWTSITSLLTGRYPMHDGVRVQGVGLPAEVPTLADLLARRGYQTFAGTDLALFTRSQVASFENVEEHTAPEPPPTKVAPLQLAALLRRAERRPVFAWLHLESPHYPLHPDEPLRYDPGYQGRFAKAYEMTDKPLTPRLGSMTPAEARHLAALYDASIRTADHVLLQVLQALDAADATADTIVVVTADHGTLLGDRGVTLEHGMPFDAVLHVPLVFSWPDHIAAGHRVHERVQLIDVAPTLLALAGLPPAEGLDGRDLSPALLGKPIADAPAYAEVLGHYWSIHLGDDHLILNPFKRDFHLPWIEVPVERRELYDLAKDPGETRNLAAADPGRLHAAEAKLKAELSRWQKTEVAPGAAPSAAALTLLQAAGYLAKQPASAAPR